MSKYKKIEGMLYSYPILIAGCKNIDFQIDELNDARTLQSIDYSKDLLSPTNNISSSVENDILYREEYASKEIDNLIAVKNTKQRKIKKVENALSVLKDRDRRILELRYFKDLDWCKISDIIDLSDVRCRQIRRESINKLINVIFTKN